MSPICDVVVLTWNRVDVTKKFVESFLQQTTIPTRLIIIDNASIDETPEYLKSLEDTDLCKFKIIVNDENKGFVAGMNQGIELVEAPFVCLANNDLVFSYKWLTTMIDLLKKDPSIGMLNPNSNNLGHHLPEGTEVHEFAETLRKYKDAFIEMPYCIGFCMVLKSELLKKVEGFSQEFYPMFFEDTDLSMKIKKEGYLIGMVKGAYVWHMEHASIQSLGAQKEEIFQRSKKTLVEKWGKMLRIAVIDNIDKNLQKGIDLARGGNFVWMFSKGIPANREDIFHKHGVHEHSGIRFVGYFTLIDLVFKILIKKKRYDMIITKSNTLKKILSSFGYPVGSVLDEELSQRLKYS